MTWFLILHDSFICFRPTFCNKYVYTLIFSLFLLNDKTLIIFRIRVKVKQRIALVENALSW